MVSHKKYNKLCFAQNCLHLVILIFSGGYYLPILKIS